MDRHAAVAVEPRGEVAHADLDIALESGAGDRAERGLDQVVADLIGRGNPHIVAPHVVLVRGGHVLVEDRLRQRDQRRVRDPGAVVAGGDLAQLVGADLGQCGVVGIHVRRVAAADRDLRGHAAHGVGAALVAGLDQQFGIRAQERLRHRHLATLGQHLVAVGAERLDVAEDVVPTPAVEPGDAGAQRMQDLVHLERRRQRLDQHGDLDLPGREAQRLLEVIEHVVPQLRLFHRLQLGQVEIRSAVLRSEHVRIVESEQAQVEQAGRHRRAVDQHMFLVEVPAARAHHQHCLLRERLERVVPGTVRPALIRHGPVQRAGDRLLQRALAGEQVAPGRRGAVLEVGHEAVGAGVERVDHHLRVDRAGDLDAAVEQRGRQRRHAPAAGADRGGVGAEIGQAAGVEERLALTARVQPCLPGRFETAVQAGEVGQRGRGQQLLLARQVGQHLDAQALNVRHALPVLLHLRHHCRHRRTPGRSEPNHAAALGI